MKWLPYPKYKNSGVDWLGDVPEGWEVKKICRQATLLTSKTEKNNNPIALENIEGWTGKFISTESTFEGDGVAFKSGDILFGKLRPYLAKVYVANKAGEAVGDFHVLRFNSAMCSNFCGYLLRTSSFIDNVNSSTYGAKMPRASWEFLGSMSIPIPCIEEQQAIAAFLNKETGRIDALIAKKKALVEKLKEQRISIISNAVTKGLPADVAPRYGLKPHTHFKPSGVDWLGDIPEEWEATKIKYVSSIRYGLGEPPQYYPDGVMLIRATNVKSGKISSDGMVFIDPTELPFQRIVWLRQGDIIVVRSGAYTGDVAFIDPAYENTIAGFDMVLRSKLSDSRFLLYSLLSEYIKNSQIDMKSQRAAQPHLNAVDLGNCTLLFPSETEQQAIAAYLDEQTGKIDALIAKLEQAIITLQEYRTALITAAVTGKIDVRHEAGMQEIS